jgi:hypothetical protein
MFAEGNVNFLYSDEIDELRTYTTGKIYNSIK